MCPQWLTHLKVGALNRSVEYTMLWDASSFRLRTSKYKLNYYWLVDHFFFSDFMILYKVVYSVLSDSQSGRDMQQTCFHEDFKGSDGTEVREGKPGIARFLVQLPKVKHPQLPPFSFAPLWSKQARLSSPQLLPGQPSVAYVCSHI